MFYELPKLDMYFIFIIKNILHKQFRLFPFFIKYRKQLYTRKRNYEWHEKGDFGYRRHEKGDFGN